MTDTIEKYGRCVIVCVCVYVCVFEQGVSEMEGASQIKMNKMNIRLI